MTHKHSLITSLFWLFCAYSGVAAAHANQGVAHTHTETMVAASESASNGVSACGVAAVAAATLEDVPPTVLKQLVGVWRGDVASLDASRLGPAMRSALADLAPAFEIAINHHAEGLFVADLQIDGQRSQHALPATLAWARSDADPASGPALRPALGPAIELGHLYLTNTQRPGEVLVFRFPDEEGIIRCANCIEYGMPMRWVKVTLEVNP